MRVVIADDTVLVREGVALLLAENGVEVAAQVADGDALLESVRQHRPDVALIDIRMPPTHTDEGLRAAAQIRSEYEGTAALVLSQHVEPSYALRLIEESPAKVGYLLKERVGRVTQLVDALERVSSGECVIDREIVDELMNRSRSPDPLGELTPREHDILGLIAEGRSNQGICRALWLSPKTVETHIRSIFAKLDIQAAPHDNRRVLAVLAQLRPIRSAAPPLRAASTPPLSRGRKMPPSVYSGAWARILRGYQSGNARWSAQRVGSVICRGMTAPGRNRVRGLGRAGRAVV